MESRWSPVNSRWTPGELQVDSRRFSSNMTIFVESWWTPDGVHQIHLDYLESTWSMWSKVKYWSARAWTKEETALLDKYREEYREANETARATIASNIWEEMQNVLDTRKLLNKGDRTTVKKVCNVLSNLLNES